MRILYVITGLRLGGAEKQLSLMAQTIKEAGNDVKVVSMESHGVIADEIRAKQIEVIELGMSVKVNFLNGYKKLKIIIKSYNPDVVHSHMIHANLFTRLIKILDPQLKIINTAHNIQEGSNLLMMVYRLTNNIPNWSTNVSKEAYEHFLIKRYFRADKSSCIPNAIDPIFFLPARSDTTLKAKLLIPESAFVFFTAGRLHEQKNQQLLLHAFKQAFNDIKDTFLIIAGEGPLLLTLQQLAINLCIAERIMFLGNRNDIPALMGMCNCFVLSSRYEGFGLVVGEAMASGKPVIATDCGGVKEVMGGYGMLVNNDVGAFAGAMRNIVINPSSNPEQARQHIKDNYSVQNIADEWISLYHNIA